MSYHGYRSLVLTGRAVKRKGNRLILHYAGQDTVKGRIVVSYLNQKEAKKGQALLMAQLREVTGDGEFNAILNAFLTAIREAHEGMKVDDVEEQEPLEA